MTINLSRIRYAIYPGSERLDLGNGREPVAFCQTENQAKHMASFWGTFGYYKQLTLPLENYIETAVLDFGA
jgi:hypothetical protein